MVGLLKGFSKRSCLKFLAQLWDPIGLVSPVTIKFRIDLQGLWSSGYGWDDILPESIQQTWSDNVQSINDLLSFQFDRKLKPSNAVGVPQIQGFSDGGEEAYGAVIFLRWKLAGGDYRCVPVVIKGFCRTSEEEKHPEIRTVGLFSTCTHVRYMCKGIRVRKSPRLGKILLDRFINHFVLDQNATTGIQAFRICQSG